MRRLLVRSPLVLLPLALSGCGLLGSAAPAALPVAGDGGAPPMADVVMQQCAANASGTQASGTVANAGKAAQNYVVDVEFLDASGQRVDDVFAQLTNPVQPAGSTPWTATTSGTAKGPLSCRVVSVARTAPGA